MSQYADGQTGGALDPTRNINFTGGTDFAQVTVSTPLGQFGYATGAGGVVTQATSKATAVTLNTNCGKITMNGAALSNGAIVSFTLTNSAISVGDLLILNHVATGTVGSYLLNAQCSNGSAVITVTNITGGSLSEAIVIAFAVIDGAVS